MAPSKSISLSARNKSLPYNNQLQCEQFILPSNFHLYGGRTRWIAFQREAVNIAEQILLILTRVMLSFGINIYYLKKLYLRSADGINSSREHSITGPSSKYKSPFIYGADYWKIVFSIFSVNSTLCINIF